jgi:hypothetical protein
MLALIIVMPALLPLLLERSTLTKLVSSSSHPAPAITTFLLCMIMTATAFLPSPFRAVQGSAFSLHIKLCMPVLLLPAYAPNSSALIMNAQRL